jgi:hypothetical protein
MQISNYNMSTLTVNDIISSYNKFQENMLVLDTQNYRTSANGNVKYFDIRVKRTDGTLAPLKIKFFNQEVSNRIKGPTERSYDQIKICIKNKSPFTEAMRLVCESFCKLVEDLTDLEESKVGGISVLSTKPNTPMQLATLSGQVMFKDPLFWIVPSCKRAAENCTSKEFDFRIFSLDDLDDETNSPKELLLSNRPVNDSNIHKVVSKGSVISGIVSMQVLASRLSFSLNTKISEKLYVKQPRGEFDQDDISLMLA